MLGNILGLLGMLHNVLWWYTTPLASQLIRKQVGTWWYTTLLTSQLIRKQVGGFIFDVGLLGPCGKHAEEAEDVASMPRTLQSMPRSAEDIAKHA